MRRLRARTSAFTSGARHQWLSGGSLQKYCLELVPTPEAIRQHKLESVAEVLVGIVKGRRDIATWLPGVTERYSSTTEAVAALSRVAARKNTLSWLIHQVGDAEHGIADTDVDGTRLHAERVVGLATMTEGVNVLVGETVGRYVLASFWMNQAGVGPHSSAVATALLHEAPHNLLRDPTRIFASLDGPVEPPGDGTPLDPSVAFASEGELWEGAYQLDGDKLQTADGIVTTSTTKLYRPRITVVSRK